MKIGELVVREEIVKHPLLGSAQIIEHAGQAITAMSAIDWERPTQIPAIAEPGKLPPGVGGLVINELARRAERAGVTALRYAGPFPTPALYRSLLRSFRASADEETFTRDVLTRALRVARDEIAVDFTPAPHERVELACGHAELRDGLEAAVIAGTRFERGGAVARLVGNNCEVWFGDAVYAHVATLSPRGALLAGPHAPPALASSVLGQTFPSELRAALADLVAEVVPAPLSADARTYIWSRTLAWADLGTRAARATNEAFALHAALWERIAPLGLARLALALTEALAPVVVASILADLTAGS